MFVIIIYSPEIITAIENVIIKYYMANVSAQSI